MSTACHPIVLGPKTSQLSPDFVGPAREIVEAHTGALSLYLQGAAGNINPVCGIGAGGAEQFDDCFRLGAMLAGETLKTWAQIRTDRRRKERRIVRSVAALSVWDYEPLPQETIWRLAAKRERMTLPLSPLPNVSVLEAELSAAETRAEAAAREGSLGARNVAERKLAYALQRSRLAAEGVKVPTLEIEIWAMAINDIALAAVSAEPLAELDLEILARSPMPHTLFLGCANGCIGYIPPPSAFAEGGMEVVESHVNYLLPSQVTPEWAGIVVEKTVKMLEALAGD
jgi:hypothetical protein